MGEDWCTQAEGHIKVIRGHVSSWFINKR